MDDNLSILIKAILDENGIKQDIKDLDKIAEKYTLNFKASIDKGELTNSIKAVLPKIIADVNKTYGLKLPIDVDDKILDKSINQYQSAMKKMVSEVNKIQLSFDNGHGDSDYQNRITAIANELTKYGLSADEANKKTENLRTILDGFKVNGNFLPDEQLVAQADKFEAEFKAVKVSVDSAKLSFDKFLQPVSSEKASSLIVRINSFLSKNTAITAEAKAELQSFVAQLNSGVNLGEWNQFNLRLKEIEDDMRRAGKLGKSLKQTLIEGAKSFAQWTFSSGAVMELWTQVKKGAKFIGELDDALTDVAYTSNTSKAQLRDLGDSAIDMAEELNTSAENILEAVKIYSTANATAEDILRKSKPAIMLSNVSGMSGSESSKTINTSLNQFELEDTEENLMDIVDTLEYVSSQLNYDFTEGIKEITEGIEASGNVAKNAGLNMQEYATMVGVAIEKTGQSGSTIGNAYKTIFSRITKASATEGTLEEDISAAEESLRSVGVEVRDSANEFRDLTDIMADLGAVWDSLDSVEKSNIGYNVAGTRQLNILNSLMGSWESYSSIIGEIDKRVGMSYETQEKYADSLQGHLGDLEATAQSTWNNVIDSETLKTGVDILNGLLTLVNGLTESIGGLGTIGLGAGLFASFKGAGRVKIAYPHLYTYACRNKTLYA